MAATFLTKPEHDAVLRILCILCIFLGCFTVWGALFGILAAISLFLIFKVWSSISGEDG